MNYLSRVLLFWVSVGLMLGGDYFNKFEVCDEEIVSELQYYFYLFPDIVEKEGLNLTVADKTIVSNYIKIDGSINPYRVTEYFLNVKKLYAYCVKNKPAGGRYMLRFYGHIFVKRNDDGWEKGVYYDKDKFDGYHGVFYIIPEGVLGYDELSVVFMKSYSNSTYYKIQKYEDESIANSGILNVDIINYDEYEKRRQIFDFNNKKETAKEIEGENNVKKFENELKKLKDEIKIKDDGGGAKDGVQGDPTKGSDPVDGKEGIGGGEGPKETPKRKGCCC